MWKSRDSFENQGLVACFDFEDVVRSGVIMGFSQHIVITSIHMSFVLRYL